MTYEESKAINFSRLSALLEGVEYYKKIVGEDIHDKSLSFGSASHAFFLEHDVFKDKYVVFKENRPSNAKHKEFCSLIAAHGLVDKPTRILCYKQVFATERKKEADIEDNSTKLYIRFKDYIDFLIRAKNKLILGEVDYNKILIFEKKFKNHKGISKLLYDHKDIELVYNELPIFFNYGEHSCKAKLDRLAIDLQNKMVYIIDLKTHATSGLRSNIRKTFKQSMIKYNYDLQQAMYYVATRDFMTRKLGLDPDEFKFEHVFIVMHSNFTNGVKLFKLSVHEMYEAIVTLKGAFNLWKFHQQYGFDFDKEYYENQLGYEELI